MTWYTVKRLLTAAARAGIVAFAGTAGARLARKYIYVPPPPRRAKRKHNKKGK